MIGRFAIFTWPVLVAQLVILGTSAFAVIFAPAAIGPSGESPSAAVKLWRVLAILNLAMSPLVFMEMASEMAQMTWIQTIPLVPEIMRETLAGRVWIWRFVAVAMLAVAMWLPVREKAACFIALMLSALLLALGAVTSHAIDKSVLVVAIDFVHQVAGALWLGALVSLLMSARGGPDAIAATAPRTSAVSAWSVGVIAASGAMTAFQWLGWNLHLLFDSAYGRALMWKLLTAAPVLLLGGYNRYWQVPRDSQSSVGTLLIRSVAGECLLLLAVLAWSAILANTPPPH